MKLKNRLVSELIPYARNARTHDETQIAQIADSIKEFKFTNPILIDEKGTILAGHGRVLAAELIGMDKVPTIELDYLTPAQKKAYILADNKMTLNAGWDTELLTLELKDLDKLDFDLSLTGFDEDELDGYLLGDTDEPDDGHGEGEGDSADDDNVLCPHCGKTFPNPD